VSSCNSCCIGLIKTNIYFFYSPGKGADIGRRKLKSFAGLCSFIAFRRRKLCKSEIVGYTFLFYTQLSKPLCWRVRNLVWFGLRHTSYRFVQLNHGWENTRTFACRLQILSKRTFACKSYLSNWTTGRKCADISFADTGDYCISHILIFQKLQLFLGNFKRWIYVEGPYLDLNCVQ
jgi:hypothetical protein